eukprot:COSAG01_NODE_2342_length_7868_cov_104.618484_1_plen_212_part_00
MCAGAFDDERTSPRQASNADLHAQVSTLGALDLASSAPLSPHLRHSHLLSMVLENRVDRIIITPHHTHNTDSVLFCTCQQSRGLGMHGSAGGGRPGGVWQGRRRWWSLGMHRSAGGGRPGGVWQGRRRWWSNILRGYSIPLPFLTSYRPSAVLELLSSRLLVHHAMPPDSTRPTSATSQPTARYQYLVLSWLPDGPPWLWLLHTGVHSLGW